MKRLYQAGDLIEAQLFQDFLRDHHIESVVFGGFLSGAAGELPAMQFPEVWLMEERDFPRGQELLRRFAEQGEAVGGERDAWHCGRCGEEIEPQFDICWKCGAARD